MTLSPRLASRSAPLVLLVLAACQDLEPPTQTDLPKPSFAQGDGYTWTVNSLADPGEGICDEANCTLREAIFVAATVDGPTSIVFQDGLTGTIPLAASLRLTDMFTTIDGDGRITIDGMDRVRIMRIRRDVVDPANPTVTLKGLTLSRARTVPADPGGGDEGDDLGTGGAILAEGGGMVLHLEKVNLTDNYSENGGAGIRVWHGASVTIRNSTLLRNISAPGSTGGAIYLWGAPTFLGATVSVIETTIADNSGGVAGGIVSWGKLTVIGSTIARNAGSTGGIFNGDIGTATVIRTTVSGNIGFGDEPDLAAGITNLGELDLQSSTITLNQQSNQGTGGVSRKTEFNAAPTRIINSIIAGNSGPTTADCLGSPTSLGYNLSSTGGSCSFSSTGDISVAGANLFTGVLEQTLKNNGGPTHTHALIPRGAAVDKGSCPGESTDQRGSPRPDNDPGVANAADGCDIGAYETVTPVADLWLSQAADKARTKQGDQVTYSIQVRNYGPETAPAVVVTATLPSDVAFVQARSKTGTLASPPAGQTGVVTWTLGDLVSGAKETVEIEVTVLPRGKSSITSTATVTGRVADPSLANNSASVTVSINPGTGK